MRRKRNAKVKGTPQATRVSYFQYVKNSHGDGGEHIPRKRAFHVVLPNQLEIRDKFISSDCSAGTTARIVSGLKIEKNIGQEDDISKANSEGAP